MCRYPKATQQDVVEKEGDCKSMEQGIKVISFCSRSYSSIEAVTKMLTLCPSELLQVSNLLIANVMLDCCNITTRTLARLGF